MEKKMAQLKDKFEADSALAEKLFSLENPADVQRLLKEQGLEFSLEEIAALKDAIVKYMAKKESGELTDSTLEDVAGGVVPPNIFAPVGPFINHGLLIPPLSTGTRW